MSLLSLPSLVTVLVAADQAPDPEDVTAGWTGFAVFLLLIAATALLCWSLVRQLRKARAARDAGVYDGADAGSPDDDHGSDEGRR